MVMFVDIKLYNKLKDKREIHYPLEIKVKPNKTHYKKGEFTRYFVAKINDETLVIETNRKHYLSSQNNKLYLRVAIPWKITGDNVLVQTINKKTVRHARRTIKFLHKKITNYTEFKK